MQSAFCYAILWVIYVEDLKEVLRTNLHTTEKCYVHGPLRMEIQLFIQLPGFIAKRPQTVSHCYRRIKATLLRNQEGGPDGFLLESSHLPLRRLSLGEVNLLKLLRMRIQTQFRLRNAHSREGLVGERSNRPAVIATTMRNYYRKRAKVFNTRIRSYI